MQERIFKKKKKTFNSNLIALSGRKKRSFGFGDQSMYFTGGTLILQNL